LGLLVSTAQLAAAAGAFSYSLDFDKFGKQENFMCGGQYACGAVATINSFIFLQNEYPDVYDGKLVPNYDEMTMTAMEDAQDFAFDGWQVGENPVREGYYERDGGAESDFLQTKKDWINDRAPGSTIFNSWWAGSPDNDRKPTITDLANEIRDGEDVEFFVRGDDFYHVMTLTEVSCDMAMNCSIRYQDPNDPTVNQPSTPVTIMDGMVMFTGVPGSGYPELTVTIEAAFAESPIPEPATIVLLATAVVGLVARRRRRG
jgi:hypothetical protein